jgi:hypothetical protein
MSRAQTATALGLPRTTVESQIYRMKKKGFIVPPRMKQVIIRPPPTNNKPVKFTDDIANAKAVRLVDLDDQGCHWPVQGEGAATWFCNADRDGHPSYCRHHAARSIRIETARSSLRPSLAFWR